MFRYLSPDVVNVYYNYKFKYLFTLSCPLRAILRESEAKLETKNFKPPSIFVWR